jgi:dethiobiotin synthetase
LGTQASLVEREPARITRSCDLKSLWHALGYARHEEQMSTSHAREFHGRDAELALIRAELERLSEGAEAVVVVEGAAGMGKSRLLAEVSTIARSLGIRVGSSSE